MELWAARETDNRTNIYTSEPVFNSDSFWEESGDSDSLISYNNKFSHLACRGVKPGQMLGPVRDGEFAYLFLMTSRREPRALTWDEAKGFAATRAESHCRTQAATQLREDLFKKYGVQIDRAAIRELFTRTAPSTK